MQWAKVRRTAKLTRSIQMDFMRNHSSLRKAGWLLSLSLCTSPAWAHHGGGTFDANKCFVFKGTVRQVAWSNPHAWIYVQVEKPSGEPELWGFEFGTVSGLSRAGFRPSDFTGGTKVTVTAYGNRELQKHTGSAKRLILPDGRDVSGSGIAGTAPGGEPSGPGAPPAGGPPPGAAPPPGAGPGPGPGPAALTCPDYQ
jgi:hypothetical protein